MKINVELKKGQTIEEANDLLLKALTEQNEGGMHKDAFLDPAMQDLAQTSINYYDMLVDDLMREIEEVINEEYE